MQVQVRRAVPEDATAIAAVHVRTWQVAYRGLVPDELLDGLSVAERETVWREALAGEQRPTVYVATSDEVVAGFCAVGTPTRDAGADGRVAEIGAIYVDPAVWRAGVARALMEIALADLRAADWHGVTLWGLWPAGVSDWAKRRNQAHIDGWLA